MKSCVVTCTGQRWELFALTQRWVERQDRKPDLWIVTTDTGEVPVGLPSWARHVVVPPMGAGFYETKAGPRKATKAKNQCYKLHRAASWALATALREVPADHAAIVMEDDDYYLPNHVSTIMRLLEGGERVVFGRVLLRFHLPSQQYQDSVYDECIEGISGVAPSAVAEFRADLSRVHTVCGKFARSYPGYTSVGIKGVGLGLPGRHGATEKHLGWRCHYKPDPGWVRFREVLGEVDAGSYLELLR